jgi:uncharacterized membrane protein
MVGFAARRMIRSMSETQQRRRTVGIAIAAVLVLFVLIAPIVLTGSSPSLLSLLLLAGVVLGAGLLMRWRGGAESRTFGTILAVVGGVSLVLVVAVLVVVLQSWGP